MMCQKLVGFWNRDCSTDARDSMNANSINVDQNQGSFNSSNKHIKSQHTIISYFHAIL